MLFPNTLYVYHVIGQRQVFYHLLEMGTVNGYAMKAQWPGKFRSNTSLHCELAHALYCPLQAIHGVIFVFVDRHWDTLAWLGNTSYNEQCKETDVLFVQKKSRLLGSVIFMYW